MLVDMQSVHVLIGSKMPRENLSKRHVRSFVVMSSLISVEGSVTLINVVAGLLHLLRPVVQVSEIKDGRHQESWANAKVTVTEVLNVLAA